MIRVEVIRRRLKQLDEYLRILRQLQKYSLAEFTGDPEHYGSAERFLQLAIESLADIGSHVIVDLKLGTVERYRDIPLILAEHQYISHELRERWIGMLGFRNILVHDYLDIDRQIVYQVLQDELTDMEELRRVFAQFL